MKCVMKSWYNNNNCEHLRAYHAYYPVPVAAMLWCGVPPDDIQEEMNSASPHPLIRGVFTHPFVPCFEVRCRIIHDAIESQVLPASRENGKITSEHISPERRYVSREHLKAWISKEHPADKPAFLFDEIERSTHAAINADSFRALQAERDALKARNEKAEQCLKEIRAQQNELLGERDSLRAMVDRMKAPGERAETTYLNIIGAMLELMLSKSPAGNPHSIFDNQAAIINALLGHYTGTPGISARTLEDKFASAKRSLNSR